MPGMKKIPIALAASIPPITAVPIIWRATEPAPLAVHSGTQPRINANEVIRIGRSRSLAPSSAASASGFPCSCENKVFIQPLQENVATNLFIWTASTRLNYELVPAVSDAGQMDFAIDYRQPQPQAQVAQPKPAPVAVVSTVPNEMLLNSTPVRLVGGAAAAKADLGVVIRDVYRSQDEVFVRFSIENRSSQTLRAGPPAVVSLTGLKFDRSLWAFQNAQLGVEYASRLKTYDAPIPVKIRQCEPGVAEVGPGEARIGLIALQLPPENPNAKKTQPTVLKILFPIDRAGNLTATLVL